MVQLALNVPEELEIDIVMPGHASETKSLSVLLDRVTNRSDLNKEQRQELEHVLVEFEEAFLDRPGKPV